MQFLGKLLLNIVLFNFADNKISSCCLTSFFGFNFWHISWCVALFVIYVYGKLWKKSFCILLMALVHTSKDEFKVKNTLIFLAYYEMSASINCFLESVTQTRSWKKLNNLHYHIFWQNPLRSTYIDNLMLFVTIVE